MDRDSFGNPFYSEIEVVDADGPAIVAIFFEAPELIVSHFESPDDRFQFTIDATASPDLMDWTENKLRSAVQEWHPTMVTTMPSDGFEAANRVTLTCPQ